VVGQAVSPAFLTLLPPISLRYGCCLQKRLLFAKAAGVGTQWKRIALELV